MSINTRTILRQRRRTLAPRQQRLAATAIKHTLSQTLEFQQARRLAAYLCNDGEISPHAIMADAEKRGKRTFLPVLHPVKENRLYFLRHRPTTKLCKNRFGIAEPQLGSEPAAATWTLDIILLPLVGFDRQGNRLGMGGGFYDRTLARLLHHKPGKRPVLIGLAHHCQEVMQLQAQHWDIPLDIIATDREIIRM